MGGMTGFTSQRPPTSAAGGASTSSSFGNFTMPSGSTPSRGAAGGGSNPGAGFSITSNDLAQALALAGINTSLWTRIIFKQRLFSITCNICC